MTKLVGKMLDEEPWVNMNIYIYVCVCLHIFTIIRNMIQSICPNDKKLMMSSCIQRNVCYCIPDVQQSLSGILVQRTECMNET